MNAIAANLFQCECGYIMTPPPKAPVTTGKYLECANRYCGHHGRLFEVPVVQLKEVVNG